MKAGDADKFGNLAPWPAAFDMGHMLNGVADFALGRAERQASISLERQPREPIQRVCGGTSVQRRNRASMPGVESLEQVIGRSVTDFAHDDSIGPVPQGCLQQIADRDAFARGEANAIGTLRGNSAVSSISSTRSFSGIKSSNALTSVVFPEPVGPLMRMFSRRSTASTRWS